MSTHAGGPGEGEVRSRGRVRTSLAGSMVVVAAVVLAATASPAAAKAKQSQATGSGSCSRACLLQQTNLYLDAVAQGTTTGIPGLRIARNARVTDNGRRSAVGQGSAWTAGVVGFQYRQTFADARSQSVVFLGTAFVSSGPAPGPFVPPPGLTYHFYELRLTFVRGAISQIEEAFSGLGFANPATVAAAHEEDPLLTSVVPKEDRTSAKDMLAGANAYFDALTSTAPGRGYTVPFSPDCQRSENLTWTVNYGTANSSCSSQFANAAFHWVVDNRRFYVVDEKRGLVVAVAFFNEPASFPVFEAFKFENGLIRKLVAQFPGTPQQGSGWPEFTYPGVR